MQWPAPAFAPLLRLPLGWRKANGRETMARLVDISVALKTGIPSDPPAMLPKITYLNHDQGANELVSHFPGLTVAMLPEGKGAAVETVTISTHNGTHLDAPYHFH